MIDLQTNQWPAMLTTSGNDLVRDFFNPALSTSIAYDRGVGFFSSGWLRASASGMVAFASNGGRARWITSPILCKDDWEALHKGNVARTDPVLKVAILRSIESLSLSLERDVLSAIAWMVADEILTFKLALPRDRLEHGEFHDKFGVFTDQIGNRISFNGSYNDSLQGLRNYESIKVFCSWHPAMAPLVKADAERFEQLWNNGDPNVEVFTLDEAAKESLIRFRTSDRPYPCPAWIVRETGLSHYGRPATFHVPEGFVLRDYQRSAIQSWLTGNGRGILAMATGSGKTLTALYASHKVWEKVKPMVLVVVCPYINLALQWAREMDRFDLQPVHCYESRTRWQTELQNGMTSLMTGGNSILPIVVTNATFLSQTFQTCLKPEVMPHFLIADEVHNLGASQIKNRLDSSIQYRLGLSATPERHYDEEGTRVVMDYFGGVVYEFTLADAIRIGVLTPYDYHPVLVDLTMDEAQEYWRITEAIARLAPREDDAPSPMFESLLIKRARLLSSAQNKLPALRNVISSLSVPLKQAIVYCGDGRVDGMPDEDLIRHVTATTRLLGEDLGLRVRRFTADESPEQRERILSDLKDANLDAVVAIRCLDEGIDVPSVRMAFVLASSTNPRQYVQRRGRLLRPAPGKDYAIVYDFIVRSPDYGGDEDDAAFRTERRLFGRELRRILEFCETARNGMAALNQLNDLRKKYNLLSI